MKQNVCSGKIVPNKNLGKKKKNQNHTCKILRNITNSFIHLGGNIQFIPLGSNIQCIPLGSNIQFSINTEKEQIIKKNL